MINWSFYWYTDHVPGLDAARIPPTLQFLVRVMSLPALSTTARVNTKYSSPSKMPSCAIGNWHVVSGEEDPNILEQVTLVSLRSATVCGGVYVCM